MECRKADIARHASMPVSESGRMDGCVFLAGRFLLARTGVEADLSAFAESWNGLPPDPYLTGAKPYRFRRHSRLLIDGAGVLSVLPTGDYLQASAHNPLFGGVSRRFAPMTWNDAAMRVVGALARTGVADVLGLLGPTLVNVHQIRILGGAGYAGKPVPEGRHRDGFDYISIHLIERDLDGGGVTTVVADADGSQKTMTLVEPMDSLYCDDRAFTHDTSPIEGHDRTVRRDVLLMSFERADG